jgi:aminoglycoside phosphotransferase (APT) family kinase protein
MAEHAQSVQCSELAVLHWDFHPENIIRCPDGSLVVIDWTGLQLSDPRFDLAWTLMLISAYQGSQWRQSFLEAYERHAGELLEN